MLGTREQAHSLLNCICIDLEIYVIGKVKMQSEIPWQLSLVAYGVDDAARP